MPSLTSIDTQNTEQFIFQCVCKALTLYREEEKLQRTKTAFRNTKLLLQHYDEFLAHASAAVANISDLMFSDTLDEYTIDLLMSEVHEDIYIESILHSKMKTIIIVNHIDAMMMQLKKLCEKKGCSHKYDVFYDFYIVGMKQDAIAVKYNIDRCNVSKANKEMLDKLSIMLFGFGKFIF